MPTIEAQLRGELRNYAVELRKLAYALPDGIGEHDFLRLSERMSATADDTGGSKAQLARYPIKPRTE